MAKVRLPAAMIALWLGCSTPAGALVVLDTEPQLVAVQAVAPGPRPAPHQAAEVSTGIAGWAIGIAALGVAGIVLRRRPSGRIVSS